MMRIALLLTPVVLVSMIYSAIDNALSPYEPAFYEYGGLFALGFIFWLFGRGLDERLHRMETQGKGRVRQG